MNVRISVIIPIYNVEAYLRRCVDSIINQSFKELEIILVDDGSPDRCGAICEEYAHKDSRIKVIHQDNGGLFCARNVGLEAAVGEYVSFIDGDDWIESDTYEHMIKIIDEYHPDMIRFGFKKMLNGKIICESRMPYTEGIYAAQELYEIQLDTISNEGVLDYKKRRILSAWSNLYHRDLIMDRGIRFISEREILNEDYLFVLQVSLAAAVVYIMNGTFYCYDTREGSITTSYRRNMFERKKKLFQMYCENVDVDSPDVQVRLKNFYIDCVYACVVNECGGHNSMVDAVLKITLLLSDQKFQQYLLQNRELVRSGRTKCICFLMRHRMSACIYWGYRGLKYLKRRMGGT